MATTLYITLMTPKPIRSKWEPSLLKSANCASFFSDCRSKQMIPICTLCSRYKWVQWYSYLSSVHKKLLGASFLLRSNPLGMYPECLEVEVRPNCNLCLSSFTLLPRHDALKLGKGFAKETNCSVSNLVCLLSLAPEAVLAAQIKTSRVLQTSAHAHQI